MARHKLEIVLWPIRPRKIIKVLLFLLLYSFGAVSQETAPNVPDSIVKDLLRKLLDHDKIDRDIGIRYLHLDSIVVQPENPIIESDSSFSFGSHVFWIVSYAALVNCQNKDLIEYNKESQLFANRMRLESIRDFDPSGDHTRQTAFKIKGNTIYVYENYYMIRNEPLS